MSLHYSAYCLHKKYTYVRQFGGLQLHIGYLGVGGGFVLISIGELVFGAVVAGVSGDVPSWVVVMQSVRETAVVTSDVFSWVDGWFLQFEHVVLKCTLG